MMGTREEEQEGYKKDGDKIPGFHCTYVSEIIDL
jgi:hypothetical protein